jgi:PAS domain S-box-containing protein
LDEGIPFAIKHGSWNGETVIRRRDGTEIPVSQVIVAHRGEDGEIAFLSTIVRDISRLVEAERAAQEALSTLDASDDAAYIFDPETLLFSYVNEGAVRTLGYSREELLEMTPLSFKPDFDEARFRELLAPMRRGDLRTYRYTTVHRHKDGHDIPVEVNFQYIAPEGETPRFIAIARDVTERQQHLHMLETTARELETTNASLKRERELLAERVAARTSELTAANEELAQAKAAAEAASRAKSAFLATMSHEIRTPMNGVIGLVDVLAQNNLSSHQAELVGTIRDSAGSLLGIIDDILDFSKIEAGRLELESEPVSVADLVEGLCNSLVPVAARKGVDLALFISPDIPERVLSDDVRLRQVLYNLIGNAIKFSAGQPDRRGRVAIRVEVANAVPLRLVMQIIDNGIGMSPETVNGLFTPFTQAEISTTRRFGGTGLGLTICKRLVDLMQGWIAVKSAPGAGTTFTVTLPFESAAEQPVRRLPDLSGLECVVVESPDFNADDIRAYLVHAGARVHKAPDATAAGATASYLPTPVVVILAAPHGTTGHDAGFVAKPNDRLVLITHGRRRRARVEGPGTITLDGGAMRRLSLLRAVAVAAGRASPEAIHERAVEVRPGDEKTPPTIAMARAQNRLILVAEDDEINQKVILQQLALLGYAAEIAGNGAEALQLWRKGRYALLLTDLHMPEMDGYTLAETIRREEGGRRRMPILALTANALRGEANRARDMGMDEYLTKPVQLPALRKVFEKWLPSVNGSSPADAPPMETPAIADAAVDVATLKGFIGYDDASVREFLADYLASARHHVEEMRSAAAIGDVRHAGAIAHKLKSSSRTVGALALGDLCAELENSGRIGNKSAFAQSMQSVETALAEVEAEISRYLAGS